MSSDYELSRLEVAIHKVSGIIEKYADHPHAFEYYTMMRECLFALQGALEEIQLIHTTQQSLINDMAILKHLFLKHIKETSNECTRSSQAIGIIKKANASEN